MPANTVYSILLKREDAHDDPIYCCAWHKPNKSGDTKEESKDYIVTGGLDGLVKVWLLVNNKLDLIHKLEGHSMAVVSVAVSPDGNLIASTSLDSTFILWDTKRGKHIHEMETGATDVWMVAFSPDGSQMATGGHMGKVHLYGLEHGTLDKVLDTRGKFALSVAWSPDGKYLASGSVDGQVCIFDVSQGKLVHAIEAHIKTVRSVAFSPNSKLIATASDDGYVKIYDVASAGLQNTLEHKCWVLDVCFSPDGTRIASAAADGTLRVTLLDEFKVLNTFHEHSETVTGVQFNCKSNKLLSVSKDKCINVYECPIPAKNKK